MAVACPCPETWVWGSTLQQRACRARAGTRHVKKIKNWWVEGQLEKVKVKRDGVEKDGYKCKACNKQLIASNQQPPQGARPQSQHLCVVVQTGGGTLMREGFLRNTFRVAGSC